MEFEARAKLNWEQPYHHFETGVAIMLRQMMEDTHRIANPITPLKDYGLRPSVTKQMVSNDKGIMRWNVSYAAVQEQGGRTNPRTGEYIPFIHYTTPGTGAHFVEKSLEQVIKRLPYYVEVGGLNQ